MLSVINCALVFQCVCGSTPNHLCLNGNKTQKDKRRSTFTPKRYKTATTDIQPGNFSKRSLQERRKKFGEGLNIWQHLSYPISCTWSITSPAFTTSWEHQNSLIGHGSKTVCLFCLILQRDTCRQLLFQNYRKVISDAVSE